MLFYDKLDTQGRIIERIEKFFPIPPESQCNQTTYGSFLSSLQIKSVQPISAGTSNLTADSALQCCDFYSRGQGYQFTVCDQGVGAYILSDRRGGLLDLQYLNLPLA